MSAIYGAEHLLRMLGTSLKSRSLSVAHPLYSTVSLPQMVASSHMDAESVVFVRDYANELMMWVRTCTFTTLCVLTSFII